mmetsp:Transcript_94498/g.237092  ORF Transcript_94498/g.237092 Transcript_94498/m.237092 type:complete len:100 (-) Transcript_94498:160-459(-)
MLMVQFVSWHLHARAYDLTQGEYIPASDGGGADMCVCLRVVAQESSISARTDHVPLCWCTVGLHSDYHLAGSLSSPPKMTLEDECSLPLSLSRNGHTFQ